MKSKRGGLKREGVESLIRLSRVSEWLSQKFLKPVTGKVAPWEYSMYKQGADVAVPGKAGPEAEETRAVAQMAHTHRHSLGPRALCIPAPLRLHLRSCTGGSGRRWGRRSERARGGGRRQGTSSSDEGRHKEKKKKKKKGEKARARGTTHMCEGRYLISNTYMRKGAETGELQRKLQGLL